MTYSNQYLSIADQITKIDCTRYSNSYIFNPNGTMSIYDPNLAPINFDHVRERLTDIGYYSRGSFKDYNIPSSYCEDKEA